MDSDDEGEVPPLSQARAERPSVTPSASMRRVPGRSQPRPAAAVRMPAERVVMASRVLFRGLSA